MKFSAVEKHEAKAEHFARKNGPFIYVDLFDEFVLYFFITILQKYMIRHKFCKTIHLPPWPTASGT
jgi:hypothetical protein